MHRKLYPVSTINQTMPCPDVCGPTCQYDCYPYSDTYALPSPPPPPPPPPLIPHVSTKHGENFSPYVIIIATLLGVAFLIISYYLVIVKNCAGLDWFRPRRRQEEGTEEDFLEENPGPVIDHPIWYIRTVGLQPSIINSIAVFKYKKGDSLIEGTDCSICLNEFQDDEILRLLPKCDHAFHIPCIDTWLRSHTNCPVCRSGVISSSMTVPALPNRLNYNGSRAIEFNHEQYTETSSDTGLSNNQERNVEVEDNQIRTDEEDGFSLVDLDVQGETLSIGVDLDENNIVNDEMQQMRRSISADSLIVAKIKQAIVNFPIAESEENPINRIGDAHKYEPSENSVSKYKIPGSHDGTNSSAQADSISIKRSLSYGGRSFFSGHSRSLSSVLPL